MTQLLQNITGLTRIRTRLSEQARDRKLARYQNRASDSLITTLLVALCISYALISGYFLGVFQQRILQQFAVPIIALMMLIFWAMPDKKSVSYKALTISFFISIIVSAIWPAYLAIALPGLPWISLTRMTLFVLAILFLLTLSTNRNSRILIKNSIASQKSIASCVILFIIIQFLTVPLARENSADALSAVINYQLNWSLPLFGSIIVFSNQKNIELLPKIFTICATILCVIGILEYNKEQVLWANHIPSFLQVQDPSVERVLQGVRRANDGLYRVNSTFMTSLSFAEYLAITIPFLMHLFLTTKKNLIKFFLVIIYFLVLMSIIVTRSRLGMIGFAIAHLAYPSLIGIRRWSLYKNDLIGPSLIALYPVMLAAFLAMLLASRRLYILFLGSGAHQASNDARATMYDNGIPMILKNPWGFGANQGAAALGFYSPSGILTIDSYYLSIGLDYGVIGFITFYGMILLAIYACIRVYFTSNTDGAKVAAPVATALISYFVIKSVLSQAENQNIMFILIGLSIALYFMYVHKKPENVDQKA